MPLLFHKNKLKRIRFHSGRKCEGLNKCVHPGSVKDIGASVPSYARLKSDRYCPYQVYGEGVLCHHPDEFTEEWHYFCYRCGAQVSSATEEHCRHDPLLTKE